MAPVTPRPNPPDAPGRYCLAVCYCGKCPHYKPMPPPRKPPPTRPPYAVQGDG